MATESFIVTALPHSLAEDADVHVAVFIAPEIVPDAPGQELGELTLFPDWAATVVGDTRIELFDQAGTIECTAHLDRIHAKEWPAVFPPDTPVLNRREPDLAERRWRTFRPAYLHDAAKLLHAAAMFSDPTSPPLPSRHPLTEPLVSYLRQHEVLRERYDESQVTQLHDRAIGEFKGSDQTLPGLEHQLDGMAGLDRFALELHRARRFYERPESVSPYQARPTDGAAMPKLDPPKPDFHERVASVGDHPALLRRLGLVIELRVADPARLLTSDWLSARVVPRGDTKAGRLTRVRCEAGGRRPRHRPGDIRMAPRPAPPRRHRAVRGARHGSGRQRPQARPVRLDAAAALGRRAERRPDPRRANGAAINGLHGGAVRSGPQLDRPADPPDPAAGGAPDRPASAALDRGRHQGRSRRGVGRRRKDVVDTARPAHRCRGLRSRQAAR